MSIGANWIPLFPSLHARYRPSALLEHKPEARAAKRFGMFKCERNGQFVSCRLSNYQMRIDWLLSLSKGRKHFSG